MSESEPATHTIGVVAIRAASASASPGVPATSTRPADAGTSARSASTAAARGLDDATKTNPKPTDAERARIVAWIDAGEP